MAPKKKSITASHLSLSRAQPMDPQRFVLSDKENEELDKKINVLV
jgi:hypothetical protein